MTLNEETKTDMSIYPNALEYSVYNMNSSSKLFLFSIKNIFFGENIYSEISATEME